MRGYPSVDSVDNLEQRGLLAPERAVEQRAILAGIDAARERNHAQQVPVQLNLPDLLCKSEKLQRENSRLRSDNARLERESCSLANAFADEILRHSPRMVKMSLDTAHEKDHDVRALWRTVRWKSP